MNVFTLFPKSFLSYYLLNFLKKLNIDNTEEYNILEFYYRVRLVIDYISGMTDDFALEEYKILHAIK